MSLLCKIYHRLQFEFDRRKKELWTFFTKYIFFLRIFYETKETNAPITLKTWFFQKILGFNRKVYWPVHFTSVINVYNSIYIGVGSAPGLAPGCYIQGIGEIFIGDYCSFGPNVGIISANHEITDLRYHRFGTVRIGNYCWIGMNAVVLPNVELGDFTIIQAGAVVKDSFPEGYCVIGGNPAVLLKQYTNETKHMFDRYENKYKYHGYIPIKKFSKFRRNNLWI